MSDTIYTREHPGDFAEKVEKHIPVIEIENSTITVRVGAEVHPMEEAHYIEWIALYRDGTEIARQTLQAGGVPEAKFTDIENTTGLKARASCNLHGVWESE